MTRSFTTLAALVCGLAIACGCSSVQSRARIGGIAAFESTDWDDGLAVVSVFEGRIKRYGIWREAAVRDYLVREYLDPGDLTKRDDPRSDSIPVLKANRLLEFETGSYGYRLMASFHFERSSGAVLRARGVCLNACGIVTHRWDASSGSLHSDSYWEGEGSVSLPFAAAPGRHFADGLPFVAAGLAPGSTVVVAAPIAAAQALWRPVPANEEALPAMEPGIGIGDICEECSTPEGEVMLATDAGRHIPTRELRVERVGRATRLVDLAGEVQAEYVTDADGYLESWTVPGEQEFRRVNIFRAAYWELTGPEHGRLVSTR